jgi:hypothetical protein
VAKLSISSAWNETAAFLARETRLVAPIALLLMAIPAIAALLVLPPDNASQNVAGLILSLVVTIASAIAGLIGVIAITHLALRPGSSVREALGVGVRRFFPLLISSLLIGLVFFILAFFVTFLFARGAIERGALSPAEMMTSLAPVAAVLLVLGVALWVRFMFMTPVATAEPAGPIVIIRRSFELSRGNYWRLLGMILLLLVVAMVTLIAVSLVLGISLTLLFGPPVPGNATWLIDGIVSALFQTVLTVILAVLVARIYAQLRGTVSPDVFA